MGNNDTRMGQMQARHFKIRQFDDNPNDPAKYLRIAEENENIAQQFFIRVDAENNNATRFIVYYESFNAFYYMVDALNPAFQINIFRHLNGLLLYSAQVSYGIRTTQFFFTDVQNIDDNKFSAYMHIGNEICQIAYYENVGKSVGNTGISPAIGSRFIFELL
jgi:hypothetical protein